ncbi:MAG: tRNA glutamyl-Q(34) synthetase GluQRS [Alphaproteobacteria bacterium]|nr:tRNA glutamyl-Q(34) synthetase GluQRS [Alphaproteobacteria bacterium]MDE2109547.1 tRNA glutamyl-Q(34) synthetase GluQRS [Alphaproteobacteria bacterium]MDE2493332.1 tRNA glutamyl-Q(34) synthetase GluQRS [Alphaproteobacteria bacterium]
MRIEPCPTVIVTRFAPSPTGLLHLGHAYAAMRARDAGERFLLRLEDIDTARCRPEYEAAILEDMEWLGLAFERPVLRQSSRSGAYREALAALQARGLLYPCFCTRKDVAEEIARSAEAPHGPDGPVYPGLCRSLSAAARVRRMADGEPYALRLDAAKAAQQAGNLVFEEEGAGPDGETGSIAVQPSLFGDVVLARKEMPAAYHLAVVVDDAFQGVTLVTRGNDLFAASHVQRLLQALLGLSTPAYAHHRLILDERGRKFSKRDRAVTLRALRESGVTPNEIRARLCR